MADIKDLIARVREWYWLPDQDRADRDTLLAHIDTLTRERDEATDDMRKQFEIGNARVVVLRAEVEAMRARCEKIARTQEDEPDTSIASDIARIIADEIAALKIESGDRT